MVTFLCLCMSSVAYVCMCPCVYRCAHTLWRACRAQNSTSGVFLNHSSPGLLGQDLSLNLEFTDSARPEGQWDSEIFPPWPYALGWQAWALIWVLYQMIQLSGPCHQIFSSFFWWGFQSWMSDLEDGILPPWTGLIAWSCLKKKKNQQKPLIENQHSKIMVLPLVVVTSSTFWRLNCMRFRVWVLWTGPFVSDCDLPIVSRAALCL